MPHGSRTAHTLAGEADRKMPAGYSRPGAVCFSEFLRIVPLWKPVTSAIIRASNAIIASAKLYFTNMPVSVGNKLGPYEILASIGAGGMGDVWKARDTRLDRIVAIKTSKAQFSERFAREAKAIAALNHPHICQLYNVGPDYFVMEYVEGSTLKGPLPMEKA